MQNLDEYYYRKAKKSVKEIKNFYTHAIIYAIVISVLTLINLKTTSFLWVLFPALGWGVGLLSHGLCTFNKHLLLGKKWEERKIKELMNNAKI